MEPGNGHRSRLVVGEPGLFLVLAATAAAYLNSFSGTFQYDDFDVILGSAKALSPVAWLSGLSHGIRPLLTLSYLANNLSGLGGFGFHLANLLIHLGNVALVYWLARALALHHRLPGPEPALALPHRLSACRAAALAAGIFALHPLQTEAVTYLSGRSSSLAAFFVLLTLLIHEAARQNGSGKFRESSKSPFGKGGFRGISPAVNVTNPPCPPFSKGGDLLSPVFPDEPLTKGGTWFPTGGGSRWYLVTPLGFLAALLCKETAIVLPAALFLWDRAMETETPWRTLLAREWRSWLLLAAAAVALLAHPRYGALLEYSFDIRSWPLNLASQADAVCYLLSRLFLLDGMNIDPDLRPVLHPDGWLLLKGGLLLAAAGGAALAFRRLPWLSFGILWFFLLLLPTNSLVPRLDLVNDRQAYLPLAGAAISLGTGGALLWPRRRSGLAFALLASLLLAPLFVATVSRNRDFRSQVALWEDAVHKSPAKARPHNNLGYAYLLAGRLTEARRELATALSLDPGYRLARNNLAATEEAMVKRALRLLVRGTPLPVAGRGP
ncbi:hypothetical protein L4X63_15165 [Geomonas sp. Red32]|uniref:tetratricopeptide repeat protein n=1 Tax=Geomonas sp. Red32 TaxID=2912856 RepID=UPI00202CBDD7|nr:hypothetical protein [Geomonas sp. Red32]MCM0082933.1 hypothetical protein [Geomonas sp. Red32]